jgi:hypothetical protein
VHGQSCANRQRSEALLDFLNPSLCNQAGRSGSAAKLESLLPPGGHVHNLLAHVHTAFQSGTAAKLAAAWAALHVFGEVGVDLCRPSRQYPGICEQSPRYRDLPQAERQPHVMLVMTCPATRLHLLKFVARPLVFLCPAQWHDLASFGAARWRASPPHGRRRTGAAEPMRPVGIILAFTVFMF